MTLKFPSTRMAALGLGLAAVLGAGTYYAVAQPAAPPAPLTAEERTALREERRAERQALREAERVAQLEGRIAFLGSRLMITDAQAPLWDAFAGALRDEHAARAQARPAPPDPLVGPPSLPERLERRQADLTARSERMETFVSVLTPLYAALSVEQKVIADRLLRPSDGGRMRIRDAGRRGRDRRR